MEQESFKYYTFISYCHSDKKIAETIGAISFAVRLDEILSGASSKFEADIYGRI